MKGRSPKSEVRKQAPPSSLPNFPALEQDVLGRWKEHKIFEKTLEATKNGKRFVFFEGPPTANGVPHMGSVETRVYKDIIPRYKTMRGYYVERKAGWDTQGLPVELETEKELGISGKKDIEKYGIAAFNAKAKESVWKYKDLWQKMSERIGFWMDFDHPYIAHENSYIESLWWIFKQIWDQKLLEQDFKVVPYCPRCGTALSSHEVAQGYQTVKEPSVYVKFELVDEPGTFILAWTTTPWTLPGNVALAVGEKIMYAKTAPNSKGERYIVAVDRMDVLKGEDILAGITEDSSRPVAQETFPGSKLVGKQYKPLFDFVNLSTTSDKKAYYIADADFVSTQDGTGVVHTAVMYGEDDFLLGTKLDLPKVHTVDLAGRFNDLVKPWVGKEVKDAEGKTQQEIIEYLQQRNLLHKVEEYVHDYPFCWRCGYALLYYAKTSWFIRMSKLRDQLLANNEKINWYPEHIKDGRFGEWLREVKDWAISRERYWGTPIPIWQCSERKDRECDFQECLGSFAELEERLGKKLGDDFDPHRPFVDALNYPCPKCKKGTMERIPEVGDTWFDSGSMPFAQWHYPFENTERIDEGISYPADFISEAIDQTRGWFYTLLAVGALLQKAGVVHEPPFKNVIVLGHIRDAQGKKLSKSLGNYIDPMKIIEAYGADAVRMYLFTNNQPWEPKNFDTKGVADVVRKNFLILWNVASFWELAGGAEVPNDTPSPAFCHVLDTWLEERTNLLVRNVTECLERYDITEAGRQISSFINDLSTWYVRRSRDRLKQEGRERTNTLRTLQHSLHTLSIVMAPLTPFIADALYQRLHGQKPSVHLEAWPQVSAGDPEPLALMHTIRQAAEAGHAAREQAGIRVRQPLPQLVVLKPADLKTIPGIAAYLDVLQDELNIKEVIIADRAPISHEWVRKTVGSTEVALEVLITDELLHEGWMRETVRTVNDLRKQARLTPADRIMITVEASHSELTGVLEYYRDRIQQETRADQMTFISNDSSERPEHVKTFPIGKGTVTVAIAKNKE